MAGKLSTKGINKNPCCTLSEFSRMVGVKLATLSNRRYANPLPEVEFKSNRSNGRNAVPYYRVADLKKWLKDFDEKQKVIQ